MSRAAAPDDQLALAAALTQRTKQLCLGLEHGEAEILELVTPVTAELLRWWFAEDACQSRASNFHAGQRQAILNVIVAHEVLDSPDLSDLYRQVCPDTLLQGDRLAEIGQGKHAHPKYCLKMATGTGKTWVLQALLIWQMLNKTAALAEGRSDPRFTRHFLIVAPGLIVYERLLDAFLGREGANGQRYFNTSDLAVCGELFVPPARREQVEQFVRSNICTKAEIGLKATGGGMIAISNWQWLHEAEAEEEEWEAEDESLVTPGVIADAATVAYDVLPLVPGKATGNSLDVLDRRWARGNVLAYLAGLPELMAFNDEAHHIHELKREGEADGVEWQKSLNRIAAGKGRRFAQVDFSATPYNDVGGGRRKRKVYFPHIVVDFSLKDAMRAGLVKALVLDKRKEIGALPLEFKAERDENGNPALSEGQRVMLRAGLQKLRRLEADFAKLDPERKPKMLVVRGHHRFAAGIGIPARPGIAPGGCIDGRFRQEGGTGRKGMVARAAAIVRRGPARAAARDRERVDAARRIRRQQHLRDRAAAFVAGADPAGTDHRPRSAPDVARARICRQQA
jgi:type III restriction enzyme